MKKAMKIVGIVFAVIILAALGGFIYFNSVYPDVSPAASVKVKSTPEKIERGKYLANHVALCMDCHSTRNWNYISGPITPGTEGKGGDRFGKELGLPGVVYARNITPAALKDWTDGEIIRAITSGVSKHGNVLFPMMPYVNYNQMCEEDLHAIVSYLRTIKPIPNKIPDTEIDFPVNYLIRTVPKNYTASKMPDKNNKMAYGKYMITIAGCADCHSQSDKNGPIKGMEYAGGTEIKLPWGTLRSANLTPDKETGIGGWTKETFIARFKSFSSDSSRHMPAEKNGFNTIMPWTMYAGMSEEDLGAIYDYLHSLKPVRNHVNKFTPMVGMTAKK